jgi:dephospho-CoA kinase
VYGKDRFDKVIVVYVSEETQIRRVMERKGVTKERAILSLKKLLNR